jgi:hypothetical protein
VLAYDGDSRSSYCIWRALVNVSLGKVNVDDLTDLLAATASRIEEIMGLKLREIEKDS